MLYYSSKLLPLLVVVRTFVLCPFAVAGRPIGFFCLSCCLQCLSLLGPAANDMFMTVSDSGIM
jgi:hypothetical protein